MSFFRHFFLGLSLLSLVFISACSSTKHHKKRPLRPATPSYFPNIHQNNPRFNQDQQPPEKWQEDASVLLSHYPHWRKVLRDAREKWQMQPSYMLAFIHQESRFNPRAMSIHKAYGFAQVKDESWDWYRQKTGAQTAQASRERFDDAVDFISFYAHANRRRNAVELNDVRNQYLAYHEGMGGFERGVHKTKPWLLEVADKVARWEKMYREQLKRCPI